MSSFLLCLQDSVRTKSDTGPKSDSFGGFKKGFLFGSSNKKKLQDKKKQAIPSDNIPVIKPKDTGDETSKYKFSEVQDAMKLGQSFAENSGNIYSLHMQCYYLKQILE